jgi:hypothetical protein
MRREIWQQWPRCGYWEEHTYPLNADPAKDPTPLRDGDFVTTVGDQYVMNQIFASVLGGSKTPETWRT